MKSRAIIGVFALFLACGLSGKPGCMDKSWHLSQTFDNKTFHNVGCNCPCDSWKAKGLYAKNKHQCLQCGHAHLAHPVMALSTIPVLKNTPTLPASLQAVAQHFRILVRQARQNQPSFDN